MPAWLDARPALRALVPADPLHVREVGDGNLNLVFIVRDDPARPGVVLKQSLPWVRVHGESWPLTLERARHEADAFATYQAFAGDAIPAYHGFDPEWYVNAMEDLADLRVWRTALNDGEIHAGAAREMGRLVARIAFHTSDFGMDPAGAQAQGGRHRSTPSSVASPRTSSSTSRSGSTSTIATPQGSTRSSVSCGPIATSCARSRA